jgi:hypothetical protein
MEGLSLLTDGRLRFDLARYSKDAELVVLPAPNSLDVQPTNFSHSHRLIDEALSATREFLGRADTRYPLVPGPRKQRGHSVDAVHRLARVA